MSAGAKILASPVQVFQAADSRNVTVTMNVMFDVAEELTGASFTRDSTCLYHHLLFGVGVDGTPDSTPRGITVPDGHTEMTKDQLAGLGFHTLADVMSVPITAVP